MFDLSVFVIFLFISIFASHGYSDTPETIKIHSKQAPLVPYRESKIGNEEDEWKLRYFPEKSKVVSNANIMFADRGNMNNVPSTCDDGKTNTSIDWDGSQINYTCTDRKNFPTNSSIRAIIHADVIPPKYQAPHYCINLKIDYTQDMATYGPHRPLWAKYGEYKFVPRQRWLHNCEHGAVIMLYHPCADPKQVDKLRKVVTACLRRHIISPYNLLPSDRPLAVFVWGKYLSMNSVDLKLVSQFIKDNSKRGPENESADGKYDQCLIKPALVVSDVQDSVICPSTVHE